MESSKTNDSSSVTETTGGFDTQIATVVVLSVILIVLLICLPIILIQLYRTRPRRSVARDEDMDTSQGRVKHADNTYKTMNKADKQLEEANDTEPINTVDVNVLDEGHNHIYESVRNSTHIYRNLALREEEGDNKIDVYEAACNLIRVDSRSTEGVPLGNDERRFAALCRTKQTATQRFMESGVATEATQGYETLPMDRKLNTVYMDPDYVDMSSANQKYFTMQPKGKKRKHVGSLYQKQKPSRPNLYKY